MMSGDFTLLAEHVQATLNLPADERDAYLATLPAGIAAQVRELLPFEHATLDLSQAAGIELALDVLAEAPPQRIGRWRVLELIGRGGMASVYRVERSEGTIRQLAACKIGYARTDIEDGLRRETATLLDLGHPGIANVLDFGHTEGGRPYMVSELVDGTDIVSFANQHGLPLPKRLALFEQVLSATTHAHERLLLHQDIKPDNILVDAGGRARLIDFGLASVLKGGNAAVVGYTPRYASPEQKRGESLTVRSDVHSLGATLAALLERTPPARGLDDARAVVEKACRDDPAERYPSAAAMAADLRAIRESRPVSARPANAGYRMKRFAQRHPLPMALAALAVLAIGMGTGATVWQAHKAVTAGERATATSKFLTRLFRSVSPDREGRAEIRLSEFLEPAFEQLKEDQSLGAGARIDIAKVLGIAWSGLGEVEKATEVWNYGNEQAQASRDFRANADLLLEMARMYGARSQVDLAMQTLDRAIAASASADDAELRNRARHVRISILFATESWPEVLALADELLRDADAGSAFLERQRAGLDYSRATALMHVGRLDEAETAAARAQAEYAVAYGERSGAVSDALDMRLQIAMAAGALERADAQADELLALVTHVYGTGHPRYGEVLNNIASLRQHQGRNGEAARTYGQAYEVLHGQGNEDDPRTAMVRQNLGGALVDVGELDAGLAHLRGADATLTTTLGNDHVMTLKGRGLLAFAMGLNGDLDAALALHDQTDSRFATVAATSFHRAEFLIGHAATLAEAGNYGDCASRVTQALGTLREVVGADHWLLDSYQAYGAYCQAMLGDDDAGKRLHALTENLARKLPADSLALGRIRTLSSKWVAGVAEFLVRLGRHGEALDRLEELNEKTLREDDVRALLDALDTKLESTGDTESRQRLKALQARITAAPGSITGLD